MRFELLLSSLALASAGKDWDFSYANQGYDFDKATPPDGWHGYNRCGYPEQQSPISLIEPLGPYGYAYGAMVPAELEHLELNYQNPIQGSKMAFERKNFFMPVNKFAEGTPPSYIKSHLAREVYGFNYTTYSPISFHVHY